MFVDEAYIDFSPESSTVALTAKYPNLIVSQTLSKAFGCAGVRLGWAISTPEMAAVFNKTKAPYNISTPTSLLAKAALDASGVAVMRGKVEQLIQQRAALLTAVSDIPFFGPVLGGNDANFVLVTVVNRAGKPSNTLAQQIYTRLAEHEGVVVRFRGNEPGCLGALRVTVGTAEENAILLQRLRGPAIANLVAAFQ